jgi:succinoglycan biosynthesis protein ExoW
MAELAVIIPYYQTEKGLLRRAIESVLHQKEPGRCKIVVVDDSSPNDPTPEISDFLNNRKYEITLLRRVNGGAGAARNTGIDHVVGTVKYIAFLDSDDSFDPNHLLRMEKAFRAGADFYFCDTKRSATEHSSFAINSFPRGTIEALSADDGIFWYRGSLQTLNLTKTPYGTNSIGYRLAGREHIRFPTEFRRACEDRFFVAELARHVTHVAFSAKCDVHLGIGVNIFARSTWGTHEALVRILDTTRFHVRLGSEFALGQDDQQENSRCLSRCDGDFWESALVAALKSGRIPIRVVREYLNLRPRAIWILPASIVRLVKMKIAKFLSYFIAK